ncbi:MAG: hypothetical protein KC417_16640, partial [Myxococcales bacterium]|nr:hypothetical protein [Myxococcales bacterium]
HSDGVKDGLFVHVGADARVTFDGKLSGSRFDIEVVGYDDAGEAVLVGEARDVTLSKSTRLRLYNVAAANCVENGTLSARALHVAVPLPNGDVLFLGGVRGENVGAKTPAQFQSAVELYDASADTFRVLKGSDGDEAIFLRVMFAAFGPRSGAGPYRIRVYGGYTANTDAGGDAVDVFPVLLPGEPDDTKVRPNDAAVAAPPVDVVVDPARGTVDFVPVDDSGVDATGWATGAQMDDRAAVLFSVPFDSPGCWTKDSLGSPTTCAHSVVYDLDPGANFAAVRNRDTGVPRLGGTISLGTAAALVWGGPVAHTVLEVAAGAGYVLPSSAAQADVAVANAAPTGFQSSTTLADGRVLLLGGLLSGCATPADVACTDKGILQSTYVTPSARVVTLGGGAGATVTDAIGLASFQASVFHSATPMRVGDEDGLLVVGGMASD